MIDCDDDDDDLLLSAFEEDEAKSKRSRNREPDREKDEENGYVAYQGTTSRGASYIERRRDSPEPYRSSHSKGMYQHSSSSRGGDSRSRYSRRDSRSRSRSPSHERSRQSSYQRRGRSRSRSRSRTPPRSRNSYRRSRSRSPRPAPRIGNRDYGSGSSYRSGSGERKDHLSISPEAPSSVTAPAKPKYVAAGSEGTYVVPIPKTSTKKKKPLPPAVKQLLLEQREAKWKAEQAAARAASSRSGSAMYDPDDMEDDDDLSPPAGGGGADSVWKIPKVMRTRDMDCFDDDVCSSRIARQVSPPRLADTKAYVGRKGDGRDRKSAVGGAAFFSNVVASTGRWGSETTESRQELVPERLKAESSIWGSQFGSGGRTKVAASPAGISDNEENETSRPSFVIPGLGDMDDEDKFLYGDVDDEDPTPPPPKPTKVYSPPRTGWPRSGSKYMKSSQESKEDSHPVESLMRGYGIEVKRSTAAPVSADAAKREAELSRQVAKSLQDMAAKSAADQATKTASPMMNVVSPRGVAGISPIKTPLMPLLPTGVPPPNVAPSVPQPSSVIPPAQTFPYQAYPVPPPNFQGFQQPQPQQLPFYSPNMMGMQQQPAMNQQPHMMSQPPQMMNLSPQLMQHQQMMNHPPGMMQRQRAPLPHMQMQGKPLEMFPQHTPRMASPLQRMMTPPLAAGVAPWVPQNPAAVNIKIKQATEAARLAASRAVQTHAANLQNLAMTNRTSNLTVIQCNPPANPTPVIPNQVKPTRPPVVTKPSTTTSTTTKVTTTTTTTKATTSAPPKPHLPSEPAAVSIPKSQIEREALNEQHGRCKSKLELLMKELERLRKNQGDLMRKKHRQKDGHNDPQLLANGKLQEDIGRQVASVKRQLLAMEQALKITVGITWKGAQEASKSGSASATKSAEPTKSYQGASGGPPARSPSPPPSHCSSASKKQPPPKKAATAAPTPSTTTTTITATVTTTTPTSTVASTVKPVKPPEVSTTVSTISSAKNYRFIDQGNHWCKHCGGIFSLAPDLLLHLHTRHRDVMEKVVAADRPWAVRPIEIKPTKAGEMTLLPFRGIEFVLPCQAFFCTLCKEFSGDVMAERIHLESDKHNFNYSKFCKANPSYAKRTMARRAQSLVKLSETSGKRKSVEGNSATGGADVDGRAKRSRTDSSPAYDQNKDGKKSRDCGNDEATDTTKSSTEGVAKGGVKLNLPKRKPVETLDNDTDAKQKAFRESDMETEEEDESVVISKPGARIPMKILRKKQPQAQGGSTSSRTDELQRAQKILSNVRKKKMQERAAEREQEMQAAAAALRATPPPLEDFVCIASKPANGSVATVTTVPIRDEADPGKSSDKAAVDSGEESGDDIIMVEMIDVSVTGNSKSVAKLTPPNGEPSTEAGVAPLQEESLPSATVEQEPLVPGTVDDKQLPSATPDTVDNEPPPPGTEESLQLPQIQLPSTNLDDKPSTSSEDAASLNEVLGEIPLPQELMEYLDTIEEVPVMGEKSDLAESAVTTVANKPVDEQTESSTTENKSLESGDSADSAKKEESGASADSAKEEESGASADSANTAKKEEFGALADSAKKEESVASTDSAKEEESLSATGKPESVESVKSDPTPGSEKATVDASEKSVGMATEAVDVLNPASEASKTDKPSEDSATKCDIADKEQVAAKSENVLTKELISPDEAAGGAEEDRATVISPTDSILDGEGLVILDSTGMSDLDDDGGVSVTFSSEMTVNDDDLKKVEETPPDAAASVSDPPNVDEVPEADVAPLTLLKVTTPPPMVASSQRQKARCSRGKRRSICSSSASFPKVIPCAVVIKQESVDIEAIQAALAKNSVEVTTKSEEAETAKDEESNDGTVDREDQEDGEVEINFGDMKVMDEAENSE